MAYKAARLLCRWDFLGKNTGVGCHFLLQDVTIAAKYSPCIGQACQQKMISNINSTDFEKPCSGPWGCKLVGQAEEAMERSKGISVSILVHP